MRSISLIVNVMPCVTAEIEDGKEEEEEDKGV
jgi:hypothetical protein